MQNMKLLDLQTGKYLELGKDWLYGGEYIVINTCKIGYSVYEAIQHKDSEKFLKYDKDCPFTDELNEPLKTLCEKTGAVVYGGRYVLLEFKEYCDDELRKIVDIVTDGLVVCDRVWDGWNVGTMSRDDFRQFNDGWCDDVSEAKVEDLKNEINKQYNIMIIFEEYSKQLRNEPNKFEELMEFIK